MSCSIWFWSDISMDFVGNSFTSNSILILAVVTMKVVKMCTLLKKYTPINCSQFLLVNFGRKNVIIVHSLDKKDWKYCLSLNFSNKVFCRERERESVWSPVFCDFTFVKLHFSWKFYWNFSNHSENMNVLFFNINSFCQLFCFLYFFFTKKANDVII